MPNRRRTPGDLIARITNADGTPLRLDIYGIPYAVEFVDFRDPGMMGMCYPDHGRIEVQEGMGLPRTLNTLWHEMHHGGVHETGMDTALGWNEEQEERVVRPYAAMTLDLLRRNQPFVKLLMRGM